MFELLEDNALVRFFGVFDGHGDFGREVGTIFPPYIYKASLLANSEFETFIKTNIKKILKFRDQRDYKDRVKKLLKQMYQDSHKKFEKNV